MPKNPTSFDHVVHAHRIVREVTTLVAESEDASEIERALATLREILPMHFHAEERVGGFFDHLRRTIVGNGESKVAALVEDHRAMERDLAELLVTQERGVPWIQLAKRMARHLQDHERLESRLGAAAIDSF